MDYKITLNSNEVPKEWYNINADLPVELPMPQNSEGKDQIASLQKAFTKAGLEQEFQKKSENSTCRWEDHLHYLELLDLKNI